MGYINKKIQNTEYQYYNQCSNNYTLAATEGKEILEHGIGFMLPKILRLPEVFIQKYFLHK